MYSLYIYKHIDISFFQVHNSLILVFPERTPPRYRNTCKYSVVEYNPCKKMSTSSRKKQVKHGSRQKEVA